MQESKQLKAAIYVRVSTEEQALQGQSIEAQINVLTQYCKLYDLEIHCVYKDLGISGKETENRPGLKALISDCSLGLFNFILVWKISRLTRNLKDLLNLIDLFEKNNIIFASYSEKFDTSTPIGRMTLQLLGSISEFERNTIIDNVKLGLQEYAKKGGKTGNVLGYNQSGKGMVVNEAEALLVRLIFDLYINKRMSLDKIAQHLNQNGYCTKRNCRFRGDSIATIIDNPVYIGVNRHQVGKNDEYTVMGTHQPIITLQMWEQAQKLRKKKIKHSLYRVR